MENKKNVSEFSDIELAEASVIMYQDLMRLQGNLTAFNLEIAKRKEQQSKVKKVDKVEKPV